MLVKEILTETTRIFMKKHGVTKKHLVKRLMEKQCMSEKQAKYTLDLYFDPTNPATNIADIEVVLGLLDERSLSEKSFSKNEGYLNKVRF